MSILTSNLKPFSLIFSMKNQRKKQKKLLWKPELSLKWFKKAIAPFQQCTLTQLLLDASTNTKQTQGHIEYWNIWRQKKYKEVFRRNMEKKLTPLPVWISWEIPNLSEKATQALISELEKQVSLTLSTFHNNYYPKCGQFQLWNWRQRKPCLLLLHSKTFSKMQSV